MAEKVATRVAHRTITDSRFVQQYYRKRFGVNLDYIPYGASPLPRELNGMLTCLGLEPDEYFLYVGRLEPENRVHDLVHASRAAEPSKPVIIVGDAPYSDAYKQELKSLASDGVHFPGAIYGSGYWELNHHAYAYVFPVQSSGTHPALIEAMASSNCVLVRDTPDNRAVGGETVRYFTSVEELVELMRWAETDPVEVRRLGRLAAERAHELYNWDRITNDYLKLVNAVVTGRRARRRTPLLDRVTGD
jgi:glycosyltransferase involved in cell wall biosynthesis